MEVGKDVTLDTLRKQGYRAFYVAIGAQGGRKVGVEGEDANGVLSGIEFLRKINAGESLKLSGKTIVIGGGNVAVDVARTAVRSDAETVAMYCLESRDIMPASAEEIEEAEGEGISIHTCFGPNGFSPKTARLRAWSSKSASACSTRTDASPPSMTKRTPSLLKRTTCS